MAELLAFVARHGLVSVDQLARRFFASIEDARQRLQELREFGLVEVDEVLVGFPAVVRATRQGARHAGVDLPPASLELGRVRHSLALVDLSIELLAAHPGSVWTTERELRRDRMREARRQRRWEPRRRVPDGLLRLPDGRRVAVELDLTAKRTARLDLLAGAYAVDPEVDAVWWFLPSEEAASRMRAVVGERDLGHLIEPRARVVAVLPERSARAPLRLGRAEPAAGVGRSPADATAAAIGTRTGRRSSPGSRPPRA
jgi:hypothetical protein